jgi:CRISPR-associated protein Cas2
MRHTYIVCYDIADPKRLRRVFKVCKNFGLHLQFSVFECDLSPSEKLVFEEKLLAEIKREEDQVLFIRLGPAEQRGQREITAVGLPYIKVDASCFVV